MNQKVIGTIIIIIGIILSIFVFLQKEQEDKIIKDYISKNNTCYLTDGTCLHEDRDYTLYIFGWIIAASLIILGLYLILFDSLQKNIMENQEKIATELKEAKQIEKKKDEFGAFVTAFNEDEQKILKAVHAQEGIKQSTLRFKTGLSKTTTSLILKSFEERKIISKKESGKTNEIYLIKKF